MKKLIQRLSKVVDVSQYEPLRTQGKRDGNRRVRVPVGHVPVFVGEEMERFTVRAEHLCLPAFVELLRRSAMEYGYDQAGVLRIPYPAHLFRRLLLAADSMSEYDPAADELSHHLLNLDSITCCS